MHSHYQVLGVAKNATTEEITNTYRQAVFDVMPKYSLYPTSVLTIDKFRKVQDAYECLIDPEKRKAYDAELRELEAEERSLFGERKARRLAQEDERTKVQISPPPYVWNQDTNSPLFWTPGRRLIKGPEDEAETRPVAYFKRASLDKQLVHVPKAKEAPTPAKTEASRPTPSKLEPTPPPKYTPLQTSALTTPAVPYSSLKPQLITPTYPYFSKKYPSSTPMLATSSSDYYLMQKARDEERHKQQVYQERERVAKELFKQKKKVEKVVQSELESRRKVVEKEREAIAKETERLRLKEEKEKARQQKKVRWGVDHIDIQPAKMQYVATGSYGAWYFNPEPVRTGPNVLRKRNKN